MKNNSRGFTLIELLAVIIILAIVALVTTPTITSTINNSRVEGAKDKAWGTIDAIKLAYSQASGSVTYTNAIYEGDIVVTFTNHEISDVSVANQSQKNVSNGTFSAIKNYFKVNGEIPVSGTITVADGGTITANNLEYNGNGHYFCSTSPNGTAMHCQQTKITKTVQEDGNLAK